MIVIIVRFRDLGYTSHEACISDPSARFSEAQSLILFQKEKNWVTVGTDVIELLL